MLLLTALRLLLTGAPATPPSGVAFIYVDATSDKLCMKDSAGAVTEFGAAGPSFDVAAFLAAHTVAYWKMLAEMDETEPDQTLRLSGLASNNNDTGPTLNEEAKLETCRQFDGSNFLSCASNEDLQIDGDFIIATWAKVASLSEGGALLFTKGTGAGGDLEYEIRVAQSLTRFQVRPITGEPIAAVIPGPIGIGSWNFIVVRANRTVVSLRINNGAIVQVLNADLALALTASFFVGSDDDTGFFDGLIDDTCIIKPPRPGVLVSGAGTSAANGLYTYRGQFNGKAYYNLEGQVDDPNASATHWEVGDAWVLKSADGELFLYGGALDVLFPWQVPTTWTVADGDSPAPTVAIDPAYAPLTDDQFNAICEYLWNNGDGRALY